MVLSHFLLLHFLRGGPTAAVGEGKRVVLGLLAQGRERGNYCEPTIDSDP